jgi:hypothetical protein
MKDERNRFFSFIRQPSSLIPPTNHGGFMRRDLILITLIATIIALISVRPFAGSWNDGSRLATVESLVDRGTFAIDDSIFVRVPPENPPFDADDLRQTGTLDRLRINGSYYSDKSPVPAVLLAGAYAIVQRVTGLSAAKSPHMFCWLMNLLGGGLPFVIAVVAVHLLSLRVGLAHRHRWLLTLSFAVATIAPAYARFVNNHIMLLAVCTLLTLLMFRWPSVRGFGTSEGVPLETGERGCVSAPRTGSVNELQPSTLTGPVLGALTQPRSPQLTLVRRSGLPIPRPQHRSACHPSPPAKPEGEGPKTDAARQWRWLVLGCLAGLGYTIDLGLGPMLLAAVGGWVAWHCRREWTLRPLAIFSVAVLPWLALHHAVNYAVAGTLGPANANPAYFDWPGCPFDMRTMTGRWQHANAGAFVLYALDLLVGQRGFLGHNLMLYVAVLALPMILRRCRIERPAVLASLAWCALTFLAYAATSNNYSGLCISIRWFVPMLAPGFLLLALLLRERPDLARDVALLSAFSFIGAMAGWWYGPWSRPPLTLYWVVTSGGLISWGLFRLQARRKNGRARQLHHIAPLFLPSKICGPQPNTSNFAISPQE